MYKILVIGSGGREHAIISKISQSPVPHELQCWPANPVFSNTSYKTHLKKNATLDEVATYCKEQRYQLVVVGPETPLAEGLADKLNEYGIPCFGPNKAAAQIESSKEYAKNLMAEAQIPTARFEICRDEASMLTTAKIFLSEKNSVVLKASGLASGKGVFVCHSFRQVQEAARHFYQTSMHSACKAIVVEEVLQGRESSCFHFVGSDNITSLGSAVDYKRLLDKNEGPNTGGMGCYSPVPWLPEGADRIVEEKVVMPLLALLKKKNIHYCGWLYTGLMWSKSMEPYVVEFNCRLGDPETQVLSLADESDWLKTILFHVGLADEPADSKPFQPAVCVVMTSKDYPFGTYSESDSRPLPQGLFHRQKRSQIYAASIKSDEKQTLRTSKGRVLSVVSKSDSLENARISCYQKVVDIERSIWPTCYYRTDIADMNT